MYKRQGHHRTTSLGYIFASKARIDNQKKNLLSSNVSSTSSYNMVNFGPLVAEIVSLVWGHPSKFQWVSHLGFITAATSLNRNQPNFAPCLAVSCAATYIYIFGSCSSVMEFCQVQNSLCVLQVLHSPIGSVTAKQLSSGREPNFAELSTGRHLYSAGRPSRWALAHILVSFGS